MKLFSLIENSKALLNIFKKMKDFNNKLVNPILNKNGMKILKGIQ